MTQRHLRDTEFIDLLDGTLPETRRAHLAGCRECRDTAAALAGAAQDAACLDVPEPSPLFWDHLSARVTDAVAKEPGPSWRLWRVPAMTRPAWTGLAAVALLIAAVGIWRNVADRPAPGAHSAISTAPHEPPALTGELSWLESDADDAWDLVRTVADDLEPEAIDEAGVAARPGSAEDATSSLSDHERAELAQLLEAAIKAGAAGESPS